jgi:hypothetical protein
MSDFQFAVISVELFLIALASLGIFLRMDAS